MKKFMMIIGAMLLTMSLNAQTTLKILPFSINPGETKTVTLDLDNPDFTAASFKCDVLMPEGVTIVDDDGEYYFEYNESGRAKLKDFGYPAAALQADGSVRIVCYSSKGKSFTGDSGAILDIVVTASDSASGTGEVKVMNQEITDATGTIAVKPEAYTAEVTMGPTGIDEVNGEGSVADGKYLKDGKIVIKKGGKEYNTVGTIAK